MNDEYARLATQKILPYSALRYESTVIDIVQQAIDTAVGEAILQWTPKIANHAVVEDREAIAVWIEHTEFDPLDLDEIAAMIRRGEHLKGSADD